MTVTDAMQRDCDENSSRGRMYTLQRSRVEVSENVASDVDLGSAYLCVSFGYGSQTCESLVGMFSKMRSNSQYSCRHAAQAVLLSCYTCGQPFQMMDLSFCSV